MLIKFSAAAGDTPPHRTSTKLQLAELQPNYFVDERTKRFSREHKTIEKLHLALMAGRMCTWVWNIVTDEVRWSHRLESILGLIPGTFNGMYQAYINKVHSEDRDVLGEAIVDSRTKGTDLDMEHRVMAPDGTVRWVRCRGNVSCDGTGQPVRMVGVCADITERKRVEERLSFPPFYDPITELPSGASLMERLKEIMVSGAKSTIAALVLDLDTLKDINDTMGHQVGDEVLIAVSQRLKACLQKGDRVGRLGRGEFIVIPVDVATRDDAIHLAEQIASKMESPFYVSGFEIFTTFAIGIVIRHPKHSDPSDRLRPADVLYIRH